MAERVLSLRDLNRATLARQMLLERAEISAAAAIERLVGLQAQLAVSPYIGLWTRLVNFQRDDLAALIENHTVVKATLMRATLHLFTADDYARFRTTLQPMLTEAGSNITKRRGGEFDRNSLLETAREYIAEQPRTFAEISAMLTERYPEVDVGALRYTVRTHLPMVQVPVNKGWSYPSSPQFTLAEAWIGQPLSPEDRIDTLILRYLAAFGPATITDMQTWSGFSKLKDVVETLKPQLRIYRDDTRRELFDLPDAPLPDADTPAPVRFLPEYDNLLLSHHKRTRVVADEHRKKVFLPGLRVASTFLIDGFVSGTWKIERKKKAATLTLEPFAALAKQQRDELAAEGERLLQFVEADAESFDVQFVA